MKKVQVIIIIVVILFTIFGIGLYACKTVKSYKNDVKNTKKILNTIKEDYTDFEKQIDPYNKSLTEVITLINKNSYYDKIRKNKSTIDKKLDDITNQVKKISSYENLKKYCQKKYADGNATRSCVSFKKTYEKSINIYIDIVVAYNNTIENSNELYDDDKDLEKYESEIKEYLDYDKDGIYLGKESTNMEAVND